MKVISRPTGDIVTCSGCKTVIETYQADWKAGTYGGERVLKCPTCGKEIVKPGTEYHGDF